MFFIKIHLCCYISSGWSFSVEKQNTYWQKLLERIWIVVIKQFKFGAVKGKAHLASPSLWFKQKEPIRRMSPESGLGPSNIYTFQAWRCVLREDNWKRSPQMDDCRLLGGWEVLQHCAGVSEVFLREEIQHLRDWRTIHLQYSIFLRIHEAIEYMKTCGQGRQLWPITQVSCNGTSENLWEACGKGI